MWTATILICSLAIPRPECQPNTASTVIDPPEAAMSLGECIHKSMIMLARDRLITAGTYPKIFCRSEGLPAPPNNAG